MCTLDIYSNKSFINWYLGYTHKQKSIITQNPHKTKKKYYKLVPWIFTQTKVLSMGTLVIHSNKSFINWYHSYSHKTKKSIIILVPWIFTQTKVLSMGTFVIGV